MPPGCRGCVNNLQISELLTTPLQLCQLCRKLTKLPSINLRPFALRPACQIHTPTQSTLLHTERFFWGSQTWKSSESRTDATGVRKSRQACKGVGMGRTCRTCPSSCPQLYNIRSACPRVSPLLCAVSLLLPVMLGTWRGYVSPLLLHLLLICQDRWASLQKFKSSACQEDKAKEVKCKVLV